MSEDPTLPVNKPASEADFFIKKIETILLPVIQAELILHFPALGLPLVKQITGLIEKIIVDKITKEIETGVTFLIIDHQVGSEVSNLSTALKNLIAAQKSGDPDAIQKATQAYANAASSLVRDDGAAQPL